MKKVIALLLALLMIFTLFACKKNSSSGSDGNSGNVSPDAGTTPSDDRVSGDKGELVEGLTGLDENGDPYTFVYTCGALTNTFNKNVDISMKYLSEQYGFNYIGADDDDYNNYIIMLETYCDQDVDGFVLNTSEEIALRAYEVIKEAGIPAVFESTAIRDENGVLQTAGVELNGYGCGAECGKWLGENYKEYFGDVDPKEMGFMSVTYSTVYNFGLRVDGAKDKVMEFVPEIPAGNYYVADQVAQGTIGAEQAYNEVAPIISAHPEIKYWLMMTAMDDWGSGVARAAEEYQMDDKILVATPGGHLLVSEWDAGYRGCWAATSYYEAYNFAVIAIEGLLEHYNNGTPIEELWPEWHEEGSNYSCVKITGVVVTADNYLEYRKLKYN